MSDKKNNVETNTVEKAEPEQKSKVFDGIDITQLNDTQVAYLIAFRPKFKQEIGVGPSLKKNLGAKRFNVVMKILGKEYEGGM